MVMILNRLKIDSTKLNKDNQKAYILLVNLVVKKDFNTNQKSLNAKINNEENNAIRNNEIKKQSGTFIDKFSYIYSYGTSYLNVMSFKNILSEVATVSFSKLNSDLKKLEMPISLKQVQSLTKNLLSSDVDEDSKKTLINLKEKNANNTSKSGKVVANSVLVTLNNIQLTYEERLFNLCDSIEKASSFLIKTQLISELFKHLYDNPEIRHIINRKHKKILTHLIQLQQNPLVYQDKRLLGVINECLAIIGYVDQSSVKHRGVNILSLDGGGSKGFVTIEILKNIQKHCGGKPIHEIFDYISGVSTGSVLTILLGVFKMSLDEIERQYKIFSSAIFQRNKAVGISNFILKYGYYDTQIWETMLQNAMGDTLLVNSARDMDACKLSVIGNVTTPNEMKIFLFRNYNLPASSQSHYDGTVKYKCWEAVRASSAAPGYYEDFKLDGFVFHDGGLLANNPTAIALHESRHLWPNVTTNCIVSIGTGRFQPPGGLTSTKASSITLKDKINRIIGGIGGQEVVHTMLLDLLPAKLYYRFNPYMSEEFNLDENRPFKWKAMQFDAAMYMRRNDNKFKLVAKQLLRPKTPSQIIENYIKEKLVN